MVKSAKLWLAVPTLVAVGCIVGLIVMAVTMNQSPPLTDPKCPATEGLTSQLPSSTGIVLDDSITSLTTSKVYEAETQDSITRRRPKSRIGSNLPAVAEPGDNFEPDRTMEGLSTSTTSPEVNSFFEKMIRIVLSLMDDPDLQKPEYQRLLTIMLIEIVNATYSRPTHRMETRKSTGKSLLPSFDENFSDGGEEMEGENRSTVNIAEMVNGLAASSRDGYSNKAVTYNLNIEKQSAGTGSVEVDGSLHEIDKFKLDLIRAVYGTGYANMDDSFNETKSLTLAIERQVNNGVEPSHLSPQSKTLKIVIDKTVIGVASSDTNGTLNRNATFKVNIKRQVSGQGYTDSIDSSSGAELSEISIEKTAIGIRLSNANNQAIADAHVFELDINTVMEEIAASDVLDESDDKNGAFSINVERQLNGLGHSNSIDSPNGDDISDIDIEKTMNGIGFANANNQAIGDADVFELDINNAKEEIAASDVFGDDISAMNIEKTVDGTNYQITDEANVFELEIRKDMKGLTSSKTDESNNVDATFIVNVTGQLSGLGSSGSIDSPDGSYISDPNIQKTSKGIGFTHTNDQNIDGAQVFELDVSKEVKAIASTDLIDHSDNMNEAVKLNIERQLNGLDHTDSMTSTVGNIMDMEKTENGIGLYQATNDEDTNIFKLDVEKDMMGTASSGVSFYPHNNSTTGLDLEKTAIGTAFSNNQNTSDVKTKNPELNIHKQVVGIASTNLGHFSNQTNDANDIKLYIGKVMEGVASSAVIDDYHYNMEKKVVGVASSSTQDSRDAETKNPELNIQKQVVGIASTNLGHFSNQPNDANDIKLDIGKVMEGVASSAISDDSHYKMEKKAVGIASSSSLNGAKTEDVKLDLQTKAVGTHFY